MPEHKPSSMILASASPRRRQLLAEAGYQFRVIIPDVDESKFAAEGMEVCEYAKTLALAKAESVAQRHPDCVVIGADTVVNYQGELIGKPADAKEAELITRKLFSSAHQVVTGLAVLRLSDGVELVESDSTTVHPKKLTAEQIAEHVKGGAWRDKAGAYAIKEKGDEFVERIEGSLTNVMGLPMELLKRMLEKLMRQATSGQECRGRGPRE